MLISLTVALTFILATKVDDILASRMAREPHKCPTCRKTERCTANYEAIKGHTACLEDPVGAEPLALSASEKQEIVDYHNTVRKTVNPPAADMLKLAWNDELAMLASRWVNQCKKDRNGNYYHDVMNFIPGKHQLSQNIAHGYSNFRLAISSWQEQKSIYAPVFGLLVKDENIVKASAGYIQMVWASSALIGCASAMCSDGKLYVCNYTPPVNTKYFVAPYTQGTTQGEKCQTKDNDGFCDCGGIVCETKAVLQVNNCSCKCWYTKVNIGKLCSVSCNHNEDTEYCDVHSDFRVENCTVPYMSFMCYHLCGFCPCLETIYTVGMCPGSRPNIEAGTNAPPVNAYTVGNNHDQTYRTLPPKARPNAMYLDDLARELKYFILLQSIVRFL